MSNFYPNKYSNDPANAGDKLRDLSLINQPAGYVEFANTKDEEVYTIGDHRGSFDRFFKDGKESLVVRNKRQHITGDEYTHVGGNQINSIDQNIETIVLGDVNQKIGDITKWQKYAEQYKNTLVNYHNDVRKFDVQRTNKENSIDQSPGQSKSGTHATCPVHGIQSKVLVTDSATTLGSGSIFSATCRQIQRITQTRDSYTTVNAGGNDCFVCGGSLFSPSSQDGHFSPDPAKAQITNKRIELQKQLYEIERHLGQSKNPSGGSKILTIAKDYILSVGLVMNDFESYRRDPIGKLVPCGVKIDPKGTNLYIQYKESPLVEAVDVEPLIGGSYDIQANNRFNLVAGSNGISMKTSGQMQLGGTLFTVAMENMLFSARSEIALAAKRIDLSADIISFRANEIQGKKGIEQQLLIDSNLNVGINTVIKGGLHVEGEVSLHHITAPLEWHTTEADFELAIQLEPRPLGIPPPQGECKPDGSCCPGPYGGINGKKMQPDTSGNTKGTTYGDLLAGAYIGRAIGKDSNGDDHCLEVYSVPADNVICMHPHYHNFPTLPLTLKGQGNMHDEVRKVGANNNTNIPAIANSIYDKLSPLSTSEGKKVATPEKGKKDTLPKGEGVRTSNYTSAQIRQKMEALAAQMEQQYAELKKDLANLSQFNLNVDIDNSTDNPVIIGNSPGNCI